MPELPEVETIKLGLEKSIIGQVVQEVDVLTSKSFQGDSQKACSQKVLRVWRRAKNLGIDLSADLTLLFHLKMTGQVIYQNVIGGHPTRDMTGQMPNKSTRVIIHFADESKLFFNDQRKFGWIKLISSGEVEEHLKHLGPEPLEDGFTVEVFTQQLQRRPNTPVKVALLDQQLIAGVGNIYACEACFQAGIDPKRKISDLNTEDYKKLHKGVVGALSSGVKHGGSSKSHYVNAAGEKGYFLDYAYVYNRQNDLCKICQTPISKIQLGGRGTYFCTQCQR